MKKIFTNEWQNVLEEEFHKNYYQDLRKLLIEEYAKYEIYPKAEDIFTAFHLTDYKDIKVVILGQDPYHGQGQAHGLAFSVKPEVKTPPSLVNIYKELESDLGIPPHHNGYLVNWAKEGILLLNTTLTVRAHSPMSHSQIGWEIFTDKVIEKIDEKETPVVFILWGNHAKSKEKLIKNKNHYIIKGPHPSPLSAYRGFFGSKPFSKTNAFLASKGIKAPSWQL